MSTMSNSENQKLRNVRELTSHLEEDSLWDLDDDWAEDTEPASIDEENQEPESIIPPAREASTEQASPSPIEIKAPTHSENDTFESADVLDHEIETPLNPVSEEPIPTKTQDSPTNEPAPAETLAAETDENEVNETTPEEDPDDDSPARLGKGLSGIEKIALPLVIVSLLALAIYSYVWLYGKNLTEEDTAVKLPIKGEHAAISGFSTYWTTATKTTDIKIGAKVLPSASITLDSGSSSTGALRIYFRNVENVRIGDTITLPFKNGKFTTSEKSNISIKDDGASVEITSSDGFHQEGDFSAYVLDEKLAWKVFVLEAGSANARGKEFKEIINTKVEPKRQ